MEGVTYTFSWPSRSRPDTRRFRSWSGHANIAALSSVCCPKNRMNISNWRLVLLKALFFSLMLFNSLEYSKCIIKVFFLLKMCYYRVICENNCSFPKIRIFCFQKANGKNKLYKNLTNPQAFEWKSVLE